MTQFLPHNLLQLFAPRDPIPYLPPPDKLPHEKKNVHIYEGLAKFLEGNFEDPSETPPPTRIETRAERLERKKRDKGEQVAYKLEQEIALWDPTAIEDATTDPFKTLFVGRINNYTSESKLRREFESYGPIKSIKMIKDMNDDKPKGYCFVEFEHERDMHSAYKYADGKKIDGRRVLVDVERGRTVKGWLPRRLGGGLGGTRRGGPEVNTRHSGREDGRGRDEGRDRDDGRDRDRIDDRRRSRSRERDRRRRRSRSRSRDKDRERKKSRRSRSTGRDRRRSRSKDRKRNRRSRSRSRERGMSRRDRDRDRLGRGRGAEEEEAGVGAAGDHKWNINVKEEPEDSGYDNYGRNSMLNELNIKQEEDYEEEDCKPQVDNGYYVDGH